MSSRFLVWVPQGCDPGVMGVVLPREQALKGSLSREEYLEALEERLRHLIKAANDAEGVLEAGLVEPGWLPALPENRGEWASWMLQGGPDVRQQVLMRLQAADQPKGIKGSPRGAPRAPGPEDLEHWVGILAPSRGT